MTNALERSDRAGRAQRRRVAGGVRVWDPFVRLFHWSLAAAIAVALYTGLVADARSTPLHIWAGVIAAVLVALRVMWGVWGSTHARFADFVAGPRELAQHVRELATGRAPRHRGHNPLGGAMILALFAVISLIALSGVVVLGGTLKAGPLASLVPFSIGWPLQGVHKLLAVLLLAMIVLHVAGAVFESLRTRENLVRAMIDGKKQRRKGDHESPVRAARPVLVAGLGTAMVLGGATIVDALSRQPVAGVPSAPLDPAYASECADCHRPFHPSLLPAASWRAIMGDLSDHFGEDASLDPDTTAQLTGYLVANSAEHWDTKPANLFRRLDPKSPLRITATPFWIRTHAAISKAVFRSAAVGSAGECGACHRDAASGRFLPGAISIPMETTQ